VEYNVKVGLHIKNLDWEILRKWPFEGPRKYKDDITVHPKKMRSGDVIWIEITQNVMF